MRAVRDLARRNYHRLSGVAAGVVVLTLTIAWFDRALPQDETKAGTKADASSGESKAKGEAEYAGTKSCSKQCHKAEQVQVLKRQKETWQRSLHVKIAGQPKAGAEGRECEACHGPGKAHLDAIDAEEKDLKIQSPDKWPPAKVNEMCLSCHQNHLKAAIVMASPHARSKLSCRDCHEVHQESPTDYLLRDNREKLCYSCHREQKAQFLRESHHPVPEGRMTCTDCHDTHHSIERWALKAPVKELCVSCHADKRGPFVYEHDPVSGGIGGDCMECHRGHGSPNRKLTTFFGRGLCLQCHTDLATDPQHLARSGDCWRSGCHSQIHGSHRSRILLR